MILDANTKDALKAWLGSFRHCGDIYVDTDGNMIEFTTMDDRWHMQKMTMPSIQLEFEPCMYRVKDLLEEEE